MAEYKPPIEPIKEHKSAVNKRPKPTIRQKRLKKELMENIGSGKTQKTMGELMRVSGFSKSTCENPQLVLQSKGFQYLMRDVSNSIDTQLKDVENRLKEELPNARYNELSTHYDRLMKWKHVIAGKPTNIIGTKELKSMSDDDLLAFIDVECSVDT